MSQVEGDARTGSHRDQSIYGRELYETTAYHKHRKYICLLTMYFAVQNPFIPWSRVDGDVGADVGSKDGDELGDDVGVDVGARSLFALAAPWC
jgi:hypothetical protein